ncbi:MAG: hypothetical protein N2321_04830 [Melioribacteraceae bacterium]|nr:hypothetical protein [Melioribacteraceae bacterium]
MKKFLLLTFLITNIFYAQSANYFYEKIYLNENGNAYVIWDIEFNQVYNDEIKLPFVFKNLNTASLESNELQLNFIKSDGNSFIVIKELKTTKAQIKFNVDSFYNFSTDKLEDFGNYNFKYRFINSTLSKINKLYSRIILPAGYVISSIDETIPKESEDNPVFPYELLKDKNRNAVELKASNLKLGEHAFIKMKIKKEEKSLWVLILFSVIGIIYLYFFKDLIKKSK